MFIDGARPDVAAFYPTYPLHTRGGWGFMVLTNMLPEANLGLPAGGNGTFQFSMYAQDRDGHTTVLGTRTLTCTNAGATKPFGAIDTPAQGGIVSGASFVNFGWALTPLPKSIPLDGSTMSVLVDGAAIGTVDYNHERADIETLFPLYANTVGSNGAVGFRIIDTTTLANGLHTISWTVVDDQGWIEGIGSRYFTVSNGAGALTAAEDTASSVARAMDAAQVRAVDLTPLDPTAIDGRRGWDLSAPYQAFAPGASGRLVVRSEEVNRLELSLGRGRHEGYLRTSDGLAPLPIGSHLDQTTGVFTWAPGVGFVGTYDFVFVRSDVTSAAMRREVRVILQPKGSGLRRPAGRDRRAAVAAGRGAAVRARWVGGGSECHCRHGDRDGARVGVSARGWAAGVPRRRDVMAVRGRMSRRCTATNSATRALGSWCRAWRTATTTSRSSRGARRSLTSCRQQVVRVTVR